MSTTKHTQSTGLLAQYATLLTLFKVVAYKKGIILVRYPVNTASRFLTMLVMFVLVYFGGQAVAGSAFEGSQDALIVGFFLFVLTVTAFSELAWNVMEESQWGTLERLYMSSYKFRTVMAVKSVVGILMSFLWGGVLLVTAMLLTGRWLSIDLLTVVPLSIITLLSALGLGFVFAAIALIFKRIENMFAIIQFGFVGLVSAPVGSVELLRLLPISHGSYLLRTTINDSIRLWELPTSELSVVIATNVFYLVAGFICFHYAVAKARKEGLLGDY